MLKLTTYLVILLSSVEYHHSTPLSGNERTATLEFLQGNWKIDEVQILSSIANKDNSIKDNSNISKGLFHQIISFKENRKLTEYNNLFGRKCPDSLKIKVDKFTMIPGNYALNDGVLALKTVNAHIEPSTLYFYPVVLDNNLLLKMDLGLCLRSGVLNGESGDIKQALSANIIFVMSRLKGKIPTWEKPEPAPGDLSNVDVNDIQGIDEP
jgi:hypothetical protein